MFELYIDNQLADFNETVNVKSQIFDIEDPSFGSLTRSFSLNIPLTDKNKEIIGYLNNPNALQSAQLTAFLRANYMTIIKGNLNILSIGKDSFKAIIEGYEWINELANVNINEIWTSSENHSLTGANVSGSWSAAAGNLYRYPLINFGGLSKGVSNDVYITDFMPMWSVYQIITKLFSTIGYQIDSASWLNSAACKELYILAPKRTIVPLTFTDTKDFEVRVTNSSDNFNSISHTTGLTISVSLNKSYVVFDTVTLDEGSDFSTANNRYDIPATGTYNFNMKLAINCTHDTDGRFNAWNRSYSFSLRYYNGSTTVTLASFTGNNTGSAGWRFNSTLIGSFDSGYHHLLAGGYVYIDCAITSQAYNTGATLTVNLNTLQGSNNMSFSMTMNPRCIEPGEGFTMNPDQYLPTMSGLELMQGLKEAYGLLFWYDELNRKVYCDTFNSFIGSNVIDYSNRQDLSDSLEFNQIAQEYYKNISLRYKGDQSDQAYTASVINLGILFKKDIVLTNFAAKKGSSINENPEFFATGKLTFNAAGIYSLTLSSIYGSQTLTEGTTEKYPLYRTTSFEPRFLKWFGDVSPSSGSISWDWFDTFSGTGTTKTTYPKAETPDMSDNYTGFSKRYYAIDKKNTCEVTIVMTPIEFQKFQTVVSTAANEGFRSLYKLNIGNAIGYFYIQAIVFDGKRAKLTLIQK